MINLHRITNRLQSVEIPVYTYYYAPVSIWRDQVQIHDSES